MKLALALAVLLSSATPSARADVAPGTTWAAADLDRLWVLRLTPGQDLRQSLQAFARTNHLKAAFVVTCAGSLTRASLRLANQEKSQTWDGHFEIVSLTGTLAENAVHLHAAVSDSTGRTIGGHLVDGCLIYTTAEIVLGQAKGLRFEREPDPVTTWRELAIHRDSTDAR